MWKGGMKACILAAGEGKRMRPLTTNMPKPFLHIANKPLIEHLIIVLRECGITDISIIIGWKNDRIVDYLGDGSRLDVDISYITQPAQLGTADAIRLVHKKFKEHFICLNGDAIIDRNLLVGLLEFYKKIDNFYAIICVSETLQKERFGVVFFDNSTKLVKNIVEKPSAVQSSKYINAGIYIFTPQIFDGISKTPLSKRGEYEITDTLCMSLKKGVYAYVCNKDDWLPISYPWDLLDANAFALNRIKKTVENAIIEERVSLIGDVAVGRNTVIKNGSYIVGPTVIGADCEIGPNCYIRPYTAIGDCCKIGNCVEIKNSIIMSHTDIPHLSYVGDSIIGERCNLGAGTKIANLRLDEKNIVTHIQGVTTPTYRRKFGAIIGDDVKTGINCSIDVATIIGAGTFIGPGAVVQGNVEPNSRIY
jgi:bifunctional UDP-N-acetylglucosamine pyrophosphorylase/glucosamine-1-phosphate N-acetyltransferase